MLTQANALLPIHILILIKIIGTVTVKACFNSFIYAWVYKEDKMFYFFQLLHWWKRESLPHLCDFEAVISQKHHTIYCPRHRWMFNIWKVFESVDDRGLLHCKCTDGHTYRFGIPYIPWVLSTALLPYVCRDRGTARYEQEHIMQSDTTGTIKPIQLVSSKNKSSDEVALTMCLLYHWFYWTAKCGWVSTIRSRSSHQLVQHVWKVSNTSHLITCFQISFQTSLV